MTFRHEFNHSGALRLLAGLADSCSLSLYVRTGPPQLFERLDSTAAHRFAHSWLYVPPEYGRLALEQTGSSKHQADCDVEWLAPLSIDDILMYPMLRCGEIVAACATADGKAPKLSPRDKKQVAAALAQIQEHTHPDIRQLAANFVKELFNRDNSALHFMKRLLTLLTTEWPRSCAGLYTEVEGVYQLRLATGDFSRWHCLPRQLGPDTTMHYLESMYRQEYFIAADMTPDYPTLLDGAPDFLFIHEGVLSGRSKQLMVLAGPGTLATLCVNRLLEYLHLLGEIHELQFTHGLELLHGYSRLACDGPAVSGYASIVNEAYCWLSQQLNISRLTMVQFTDDDHMIATGAGGTVVGTATQADDYALYVPTAALSTVRQGKAWYATGAHNPEYTEQQAHERLVNNVLSELYLPLRSPGGVIGMLIVGSSSTGRYLADSEELLHSVAGYFSLHLQSSHKRTPACAVQAGATT